nr:MAG TPA: hypothetical protein [Caudoviricetes sp.]
MIKHQLSAKDSVQTSTWSYVRLSFFCIELVTEQYAD